MKTDNVLVSREWLEKLIAAVTELGSVFPNGILATGMLPRDILAMPDFIESKQDVEVVKYAIDGVREHFLQRATLDGVKSIKDGQAQAAINALRYRKDGE
jgi:hypothetical protein